MQRIDEMPEYRASLGKSTHDLSHKFGFTASVAHLLPVFHDFLNPGETVELGFNYNLRTQPLQSAAMVDITAHVEYFFVPMQLLYEPFGSMYYNINDNYSSNYPQPDQSLNKIQKDFPVFDFSANANGLLGLMQSYDGDTVGFEEWVNHVYRLFDMLGYNNTSININSPSQANWNPNVFPYPLLAYQCIYQYYYRLDTRERFDQYVFNWDRFYNTPLVDGSMIDYKKLFRLRYRPKDNDYFTDQKVSPIVDVLNLNRPDLDAVNHWLTRSNFVGSNGTSYEVLKSGGVGSASDVYGNTAPSSVQPTSNVQTNFGLNGNPKVQTYSTGSSTLISPNGLDINTANIRAMFAAEKLWSITGRSRKHYDDQTLAHFGFNVPHDVKHEISCFGHDRSKIHIGEVISTSNVSVDSQGSITGAGGLGEIAGKGYGSLQSKNHKFTAPCHGVVMAILSFVPDLTYGKTYLKANAVASRNDLYTPEYDHLGMQPIFGYESMPYQQSTRNIISGWQYRYEQWKRRFNRVSKAFTGTGSLDSWMLDFVPSRTNNLANAESFETFLHNPSELNQIMLVNYINTGASTAEVDSTVYDGDPFVVDSYIHCKKVSTMSDYSLPRLDA